MKIAIGADHNGFSLKQKLVQRLKEAGHEVTDHGTDTDAPCDYPLIAEKVARDVALGRTQRGVLLCGSGIGMAIAANKIPGVRAAVVMDEKTAALTRAHNDSNVVSLDSWNISEEKNMKIVDVFLETPFSNIERHAKRVEQIRRLEEKYAKALDGVLSQ